MFIPTIARFGSGHPLPPTFEKILLRYFQGSVIFGIYGFTRGYRADISIPVNYFFNVIIICIFFIFLYKNIIRC